MRNCLTILVLIANVLILSCASGLQSFKEPTSDATMLVVGNVVLEDNYYSDETGVYKADIEVAVLGKTQDGKSLALWANTDANGYFALADVPKGEYVIQGIRALIGTGSLVTITNRLRLSTDVYTVSGRSQVLFNGQYFPFEPVGRIQSLQYNLFHLDRMSKSTNQVGYENRYVLKDVKLLDGEILNAAPVEKYFIDKYPASLWKGPLEESMKVQRFKR
jgi:hypothetical protein